MSNKVREVYLDHAATTYVDLRVMKAMLPYFAENFGNPSSLYRAGRKAKQALTSARTTIARILNCEGDEIIFTSGGTESDNLAILGIARATLDKTKRHIITSCIEHQAVLQAFKALEGEGFSVTYLKVDQTGLIKPADLAAAIRDDTILVSLMYANNEVGTIQPIKELAAICKSRSIPFHTDACQAAGALSLDTAALRISAMTLNSSKIYGPKGVGLLYIKQGIRLKPVMYGGGQEKSIRSGTENMPAIVGFAKALELIYMEQKVENKRLIALRDNFIAAILKSVPDTQLNGDAKSRLPNNINIAFNGVDAESMVLLLDQLGIACASGSACDSATEEPSHVVRSITGSLELARSSIRFTLGKKTSQRDLDYTLECLVAVVTKLRSNA